MLVVAPPVETTTGAEFVVGVGGESFRVAQPVRKHKPMKAKVISESVTAGKVVVFPFWNTFDYFPGK
jgi:hypothetical protein